MNVRTGIAGNGNVLDVGRLQPRGIQAMLDRERRKASLMFEPGESLFFDRTIEAATRNGDSAGVAVIGVQSKDVHLYGELDVSERLIDGV